MELAQTETAYAVHANAHEVGLAPVIVDELVRNPIIVGNPMVDAHVRLYVIVGTLEEANAVAELPFQHVEDVWEGWRRLVIFGADVDSPEVREFVQRELPLKRGNPFEVEASDLHGLPDELKSWSVAHFRLVPQSGVQITLVRRCDGNLAGVFLQRWFTGAEAANLLFR